MPRFSQVDVFTDTPFLGNPVAVVHDADAWDDDRMAAFARWTNLSETTFLVAPTDPAADYRVRIFTPGRELPFAGHPTIGSAHAWLEAGGVPAMSGRVVQECGVGLVELRRDDENGRLAFAAPPLVRDEPLDEAVIARATAALGIDRADVVDHRLLANGPTFQVLRLADADRVIDLAPDMTALGDLLLGVVAPYAGGRVDEVGAAYEVRMWAPGVGVSEDPITGSLNACLAQWMIGDGTAPGSYIASQGTALRRRGRVFVDRDGDRIWIGGDAVTCVRGTVADSG